MQISEIKCTMSEKIVTKNSHYKSKRTEKNRFDPPAKPFMRIILSILLLSVCYPQTEINSNITSNTTWTLLGSPYNVTDNFQLYQDVTLEIEPGVIINGNGNKMYNFGTLNAIGNEQNKITFNDFRMSGGLNSSSGPYYYYNLKFCC